MKNKRELLHSNKYFNVYKGDNHYAEYHGNEKGIMGSALLIFNHNKTKILLIKNYRDAIDKNLWETPRGGADGNETYQECATREAKEETGYNVTITKSYGHIAPESGTVASCFEVFEGVADENETPSIVDTDDVIEDIQWFEKETVLEMVKNEKIVCGITLSLILKHILLS